MRPRLSLLPVFFLALSFACDRSEPTEEKSADAASSAPAEAEAEVASPAVEAEAAPEAPETAPAGDGVEAAVEPTPAGSPGAAAERKQEAPASPPPGAHGVSACTRDADCSNGVCIGDGLEGCGGPKGRCAEAKCTRDRRAFCGCDGKTFYGSSTCPGAEYAYQGECKSAQPEGAACFAGSDCKSGFCEGQGCGKTAGKCVSKKRLCTTDAVEYCGCDGKTFRASGQCPNRRYRKRGACGS